MDICRDCTWSREGGQFCVNPALLSDYGEDEGIALSMLTEGQVMTDCLRRVGEPDCRGYSEKPFAESKPSVLNLGPDESFAGGFDGWGRPVVRKEVKVADPFYQVGFWLEFAVIMGLLFVMGILTGG